MATNALRWSCEAGACSLFADARAAPFAQSHLSTPALATNTRLDPAGHWTPIRFNLRQYMQCNFPRHVWALACTKTTYEELTHERRSGARSGHFRHD
jgi:hypothetical protein